MSEQIERIKSLTQQIQKAIFAARIDIPIEATQTHKWLRHAEEACSNIIDYIKHATDYVLSECPAIEYKPKETEKIDELPF